MQAGSNGNFGTWLHRAWDAAVRIAEAMERNPVEELFERIGRLELVIKVNNFKFLAESPTLAVHGIENIGEYFEELVACSRFLMIRDVLSSIPLEHSDHIGWGLYLLLSGGLIGMLAGLIRWSLSRPRRRGQVGRPHRRRPRRRRRLVIVLA